MPTVTARFRWTADDLIVGRKYALRQRPMLRIFYLCVFGGILVPLISQFKHTGIFEILLLLVVPFALVFAMLRLLPPLLIRYQFRKRPDANHELEWIVSEQGIKTSSPATKAEIQWSAFQKVISTPSGFLFMPNAQIFHFIPTRAFATPADIEALKTLARQHAREFKEFK